MTDRTRTDTARHGPDPDPGLIGHGPVFLVLVIMTSTARRTMTRTQAPTRTQTQANFKPERFKTHFKLNLRHAIRIVVGSPGISGPRP